MIICAVVIVAAFLYQYFDELQDRCVNSDWLLFDFWTEVFSLQFLDKDRSWTRKWKNGDPEQGEAFFGSSTFLVFLTDGEHLFQLFKQLTIAGMLSVISWPLGIACMVGVYAQGASKKFTKLK